MSVFKNEQTEEDSSQIKLHFLDIPPVRSSIVDP